MIELLQGDIERDGADAARLAKESAKHDEDITTGEVDYKAATKVRETENAACIATRKGYAEPIELDEDVQALYILALRGECHKAHI